MLIDKCEKFASIIKGYRSGEIAPIDAQHVEKWINQFDEKVRATILDEMTYVFSEWYLSRDYIIEKFLDKIPSILQEEYGFSSEVETCMNVSFVNMQGLGQSQKLLVSELKRLKNEQYGISLSSEISDTISHYAYIDDGYYSGSHALKDIYELAHQLKPGDTIDVFYLIVCTSGFRYRREDFKKLAEVFKIDINFHPYETVYNERYERREYKNGTWTTSWQENQMSLWPSSQSKDDPDISEYFEYLKTLSTSYEKMPYRNSHWVNDPGIFTSNESRSLVEHEFLKMGIMISNAYPGGNKKGMYPLGYNLWPSFGFGVLFATEYNVPNNAPLVIWADYDWYPLLPRRKNKQNDSIEVDENIDSYEGDYPRDSYDICPDCGNLFGINEDGGNGFCINCAHNH